MIDLYLAATPNGLKLKLYLAESGLEHRAIPVRLSAGEQFQPQFLAISPNNKIPAIVDHAPADGGAPLSVFESGAILLYLARKTGQLWPREERAQLEATQWLFWQMAGLGPMAGQAGHFRAHAPEPVPYAIERYTREVKRLFGVLDRQLQGRDFIAGDAYSIADIACYPWIVPHAGLGQNLADTPDLQRWFESIRARPATRHAYEGVDDPYAKTANFTEEERRVLFGSGAES
ncbi:MULTISPECIES: glutathione binding-like protein [unclassified Lysobacter]|uniref:glutathione binding-like protein n=1 Tax=unclassified Lysobacter TaxID=2635362 RepID=UPI001BEBB41C|nr:MULTISPECIES: glutathione binding-like protein [unclassified Lysobacter]MBT2748100.1 glutathione S-transferase family protein [Lysobacter sp. ISL-42]MBT2754140.1 glutathione S-transferase family protein [Lysobacter sp. ISL-50]MBT2776034.1 glutathione S-transferase family protein [Lysobacter sp. ISL-54]MBT2784127.1 glutathione S-transferase family protein [Lysobacter sp. ISL-52]